MAPLPVRQAAVRASVLVWGIADTGALGEIITLHHKSLEGVDPGLVRPETDGFFADLIAGAGRIITVREGGSLIAYAVLQWQPDTPADAEMLGLTPETPLAKLAGAAVDPAWRGRGLHDDLITARIAEAAKSGFKRIYATAAPANAASWSNLIAHGLHIRALKTLYGGHWRYMMCRDPGAPALPADAPTETVEPENTDAQLRLLRTGWQGTGWTYSRPADAVRVIYRRLHA